MTALGADSAVTSHNNDNFHSLPPAPPMPDHPLNPPGRQIAIPAVMVAERGLPVTSTTPPKPASPARSMAGWRADGRMDWRWVARQLAAGRTPEEVADELGCKPSRIHRTLGRSPRFLRLVAAERERRLTNHALGVDQFRELVLAGLTREAAAGNPRVMLWLAARLPGFLAEPKFKLSADVAQLQAELAHHWRTGEIPEHWPRALKERREWARLQQEDERVRGLIEGRHLRDAYQARLAGEELHESNALPSTPGAATGAAKGAESHAAQ